LLRAEEAEKATVSKVSPTTPQAWTLEQALVELARNRLDPYHGRVDFPERRPSGRADDPAEVAGGLLIAWNLYFVAAETRYASDG